MSSGIVADNNCSTEFKALQLNHKYHYIIFKINKDKTKVEILKDDADKEIGKREKKDGDTFEEVYKEFLTLLKQCHDTKDCRFAAIDAHYTKDGKDKSKVCFLYYSPDDHATTQAKMTYSSTRKTFQTALGKGIQMEIQGNDGDDISLKTIQEKLLAADKYQ